MTSREVRDALGRRLQRGDRVVGRDTRAQWSGSVAGLSRAGRVLIEHEEGGRLVTMEPTELLRQQLVTSWPAATPTPPTGPASAVRSGYLPRRPARARPLNVQHGQAAVFDKRNRRIGLRDQVQHDDGRVGLVLRVPSDVDCITVNWSEGGTSEVPGFEVVVQAQHLSSGGPR
jgi:hypothetical protein